MRAWRHAAASKHFLGPSDTEDAMMGSAFEISSSRALSRLLESVCLRQHTTIFSHGCERGLGALPLPGELRVLDGSWRRECHCL